MKKEKKKDTISQLMKEKKKKEEKKKEEEQNDSEEEQKNEKNEVKEQMVEKSDKPKTLKDLINSMGGDAKPKQKAKKQKNEEKNGEKTDKPRFINSKGTGNADKKIDNKEYIDDGTESGGAKKTKNYLLKMEEKKYDENIAKPKFTGKVKEGDNQFVELNKEEDVSYNFIK
jgi:hypothetical protein